MPDRSRGLSAQTAANFGNLAPDPLPRARRVFNPVVEEEMTAVPAAAEAKPINKGGRPKGPPKVKKTFYLASDLTTIQNTQLNLAKHAGVLVKDESELVDLALEVLAVIAANTEYTEVIDNIYNNKLKR